jgi:hypothetical protein
MIGCVKEKYTFCITKEECVMEITESKSILMMQDYIEKISKKTACFVVLMDFF